MGCHRILPVHTMLLVTLLAFSSAVTESAPCSDEELIFVMTVSRHGSRGPTHIRYDNPYGNDWPYGLGNLTPMGMRQHFVLGGEMRKRYVEDLSFLSSSYNFTEFHAESTDSSRTLASSRAFLSGLFPPGTGPVLESVRQFEKAVPPMDLTGDVTDEPENLWALPFREDSIPVSSTRSDHDFKLHPTHACKNLDDSKDLNWKSPEVAKWYQQEVVPLIPELAQVTGRPVEDFDVETVSSLMGQIRCEVFELRPHPWSQAVVDLAQKSFEIKYSLVVPGTPELVRLGASAFLFDLETRILANVSKSEGVPLGEDVQEEFGQKFVAYFAHDSTLSILLNGLGSARTDISYASTLVIEIWKRSSQYFAKIQLNDKPIVPWYCEEQVDCPLENLIFFIQSYAVPDFEFQCLKEQKYK